MINKTYSKERDLVMNKPILLVMAAGMGSRYGGLKQIDPVGQCGEIIMDFSIHDAFNAGFRKVVFIIKREMEKDFREVIGNRIEKIMEVQYAFQCIDDLPDGYSVPEGRTKPWGTGHAVLAAREYIDAPFAVINADDYYGVEAFRKIYDFLETAEDDQKQHFAMVGYSLMNTLSEHGHVARGVCSVDEKGMLSGITERTRIEKCDDGAEFTEDDGNTWTSLGEKTIVSMNMWGFTRSLMDGLKADFPKFLDNAIKTNPLKAEYFLPFVVNDLLDEGKADVTVLTSPDKWFGVTYKEDKPIVVAAIKKLTENGVYHSPLWQ